MTLHAPLKNEHIGLGLSVLNDKIGPTNNTSVFSYYAFIIRLAPKSKLAFGLSAGVNIFQADLNALNLDEQFDPVFQNNINNHMTPNFGFGMYYSRERFYAGISVPNLLENNYSSAKQINGNILIGEEQRHYFFIVGTILDVSDNLAFKPTMLIKVTSASPVQADLTASFIIMKKFLLGAMFRTGESFGGLVGLDVTDKLHIGYSFDFSYGFKTFKYNKGSHEILLRYDFIHSDKSQSHSPKYF